MCLVQVVQVCGHSAICWRWLRDCGPSLPLSSHDRLRDGGSGRPSSPLDAFEKERPLVGDGIEVIRDYLHPLHGGPAGDGVGGAEG